MNIRNLFAVMLLAIIALLIPVSVRAQGTAIPVYKSMAVSVPATSLAAATTTNLYGGWTNTTYVTNTALAYSASSAAFVTNTTISTNNVLTYANFDAQGQQYVGLQFEFAGNGSTSTNVDIVIQRSVTGVSYDTANNQTVSFAFNGSTAVVGVTNITMNGFGYGRIYSVFNRDSARTLTNLHVYASQYRFRN